MKNKVLIVIIIFGVLFIIGYIISSGLLLMKKNVHPINISENKEGNFIAHGSIVSLLFNEDATESTFDSNHYPKDESLYKRPLVPGRLSGTDGNANLTHSIISSAHPTYDNGTLTSNDISLLTKIILSSLYDTNRIPQQESSAKQFLVTAKGEPQILSGNWMFIVDHGMMEDFKAKFTMVKINGMERHIYEFNNFRPSPNKNFINMSPSEVDTVDGIIDINLIGQRTWKDVNCTIIISKDNIIKVILNRSSIGNLFNGQPIYGIIEFFEENKGNQKTVEDLEAKINPTPIIESRSKVRNNTTHAISKIIDSLKQDANHDLTERNMTYEENSDQINIDVNNLSHDILKNTTISEGSSNISIVTGVDKLSNDSFFYPQNLFVMPGSTITWINKDSSIHTATSNNGEGSLADYTFDTGFIQTGQSSKSITMPQKNGVISYYCKVHPFMTGKVTVTSTLDKR
jgi:plastocyanin